MVTLPPSVLGQALTETVAETWQEVPELSWRQLWKQFQWIGLRENLQETIDFPIKYGAFL